MKSWTKVTKENFEKFTKKYVGGGYEPEFINIKLPTNEKEFKEFTKQIYGVELGIYCFAYPTNFSRDKEYRYGCKYRITGIQENVYSKNEIYKLWDKKYGQYDGLKILLKSVFGELTCGGVAGVHYGETKCSKDKWEIVKNWDDNNNEKYIDSIRRQREALNAMFGFDTFR